MLKNGRNDNRSLDNALKEDLHELRRIFKFKRLKNPYICERLKSAIDKAKKLTEGDSIINKIQAYEVLQKALENYGSKKPSRTPSYKNNN